MRWRLRWALLGDYGQQLDIEDLQQRTQQQTARQRAISGELSEQAEALRAELAEVQLVLRATLAVLEGKNLVSVVELQAMFERLSPPPPVQSVEEEPSEYNPDFDFDR